MADLYPPPTQKSETKPHATFLTKLYRLLLERSENHHMIRWDPQGEHIVVERPEQLALHVLPSIYCRSRFTSLSRQLNIYGFMRKVNPRNADPAVDDPDASTCDASLRVSSSQENTTPRTLRLSPAALCHRYGSWLEQWLLSRGSASADHPLRPPHMGYHHSPHPLNPLTPGDDSPTSPAFNSVPPYSGSSQYPDAAEQSHWSSQNASFSSHNGSLSSLLNPSNGSYSRPAPTIDTYPWPRIVTIIQKPTVPTWFLNREKDIVDGKNSQILSNSKLCDDLEHLKRSAHIVVSATTGSLCPWPVHKDNQPPGQDWAFEKLEGAQETAAQE
ncbi:hypothetical protein B0H13DRAFT_2407595 [Mycena leptocephala]|nr:hypothetical protein B0H13DRAFT_2407595 [Mycena leptocephala]